MKKIKFSERIRKLIGLKPDGPVIYADAPEDLKPKPIVLIKPGPDVEPPKPVKPKEEVR